MTSLGIRTGGLTTQSFGWLAKKHHLTEAEVRNLDQRYKHADLDRSGQLDKEELKVLLKATVASAASEAGLTKFLDSQWHNVDRDGNGTVDFDEFLNLYGVLKATGPNGQQATKAATKPAAGAKPAEGAKAGADAGKAAAPAAGAKASKAGLGVKKQKKPKTKSTKKVVRRQVIFTPSGSLTEQNYITNEVCWSAIRNNHAFLVRRGLVTLSSEKGNLRNVHSRSHSGLVSNRTVDLSNVDGGVSLRLNAPSAGRRNQPARQYTNTKFVSDNRGVARQLKNQLKGYRKGATNAALTRMTRLKASAPGVNKRTQKVRGRRAASSNNNNNNNNQVAAASSNTAAASTQTTAV